jgi:hypothetical protein
MDRHYGPPAHPKRNSGGKLLESQGSFGAGHGRALTRKADAMHALPALWVDALEAFTADSPEEAEYAAIAEALEANEMKR